jgi:hypothetical protein
MGTFHDHPSVGSGVPVHEIGSDGGAVPPPLRSVFEGATAFGLTGDEVWQTFDESLSWVGAEATVAEFLEEVNGALAFRILAKQRRLPMPGRRGSTRASDPT